MDNQTREDIKRFMNQVNTADYGEVTGHASDIIEIHLQEMFKSLNTLIDENFKIDSEIGKPRNLSYFYYGNTE